ncbi:hypothetical protein ILYODFUR_013734 [Ilyodon furcidens]|uniref:Uncharacterized protein n=1 Tax=Ilyodon furcidens TaxID=33524 RepID=A0ABV0TK92_9TELE
MNLIGDIISQVNTKPARLPFRLDAIFQDSSIALSSFQWQNIDKTTVCFDYSCMDGCFTNARRLKNVKEEKNVTFLKNTLFHHINLAHTQTHTHTQGGVCRSLVSA